MRNSQQFQEKIVNSTQHTVCGVDPGLSGGFAILDQSGRFIRVGDLRVEALGKRKLIAARELADILTEHNVTWVAIEDVATRPGQGITGAGNFMKSVGTIYGVACALGCTVSWTPPAKWKRYYNLIGKEKDASRVYAIDRFPDLAPQLKRKKDVDRAEAALIAAHCLMTDVAAIERLAVAAGVTSKRRRSVNV
jgi:Holliday junction resolvasome RuvABC endonuclease subunit